MTRNSTSILKLTDSRAELFPAANATASVSMLPRGVGELRRQVMKYWEKLQDPRWQKKRLKILERDGFKCRDCGATEKTLHVHHCFYENGEPWDARANVLLTVCADFHAIRQEAEDDAKRALGYLLAKMTTEAITLLSITLDNEAHREDNSVDTIAVSKSIIEALRKESECPSGF